MIGHYIPVICIMIYRIPTVLETYKGRIFLFGWLVVFCFFVYFFVFKAKYEVMHSKRLLYIVERGLGVRK